MHRETSGIYFSYGVKSAYHDSCIPKSQTPAPAAGGGSGKNYPEADFNKCDAVTQSKIWKESVGAEKRCLKNWEDSWGFMTEFDAKGNQKEKEELPEKSNMFSEDVPNTNSGNYGSRLASDPGKVMQNLEFQFYSERRRRKLPSDMICY